MKLRLKRVRARGPKMQVGRVLVHRGLLVVLLVES